MAGFRILIADDEERIRRLITDFLKLEGFEVVEAADGRAAFDIFISDQKLDMVILDVMMPEMDGWTVCSKIRKMSHVPIIMLTARSEPSDEIYGFGLGADEYITKPFNPMILLARVQALLRRSGSSKEDVRIFESLRIDQAGHAVYVDDEEVELSPKEFELLMFMANNEGIALTRDQILNSVWDYDYFGDVRTVDTHIKKLRLKLGKAGDYIQTIRGHGYKFEVKE
ncbi:MAG: response regulator transcription factor [Clostridia bacterium]|nr:response regulator transcription factor [Clostridia bacterium]